MDILLVIRDLTKYNHALELRRSGKSIRSIAKLLRISTSTSSVWCRKIVLSEPQKIILASNSKNIELLRTLAKNKHLDKIRRDNELFNDSKGSISKLTKEQFFIAGLALYWAEGFKNMSEQRVGFCNSDPKMIRFMLEWFKKFLNVVNEDFTLRAEFNFEHLDRQEVIENYWVSTTGIPREQFNKPFLQKAKQLRKYPSRDKYHGVLRIRIRRSSSLLVRIRGLIEGLNLALVED